MALLSWGEKDETCLESIWTNGKAMFIQASGEWNKRVGENKFRKTSWFVIFSIIGHGKLHLWNLSFLMSGWLNLYFHHIFQIQVVNRILAIFCNWDEGKGGILRVAQIHIFVTENIKNQFYDKGILFVDPIQHF